jgi:hypothetical protein
MTLSAGKCVTFAAIVTFGGLGLGASAAHANDFFSALFGAMTGQASRPSLPFASDGYDPNQPPAAAPSRHSATGGGGRQAFCVRTCDGRYFPLSAGKGQSRAESCNSFCPASDTKVFYGSNIDHAASESGKSYSSLANAFRYRNEIVAGCTCNGKDQFGLAKIDVQDDPTLRKGDIVAGEDGLMVAGKVDRRGASLNFSPASAAVKAKFEHLPVVASQ